MNETQAPLVVYIRGQMLDDTDIASYVDRRVYDTWADKDSEMPYITFRLENNYDPDGLIARGTLYIDIWDYSQTQQRMLEIRGHILRLFDRQKVSLDGIRCARFFLQTSGNIAEETQNIWHHALQFNVRYDRKVELQNIYGSDSE